MKSPSAILSKKKKVEPKTNGGSQEDTKMDKKGGRDAFLNFIAKNKKS